MVSDPFDITRIERPDPALLRYYILCSLASGPLFPLVLIPLLCRYYTLRYRFDDRGISLSWGVLFRSETYLTYKRIQDIHLNRNIIQRWLGLATLTVQTASGAATPEMKIEGVLEAEPLRDYLYSQMRGTRHENDVSESTLPPASISSVPAGEEDVLQLLMGIRDSIDVLTRRIATMEERQ
ncbi:PH domain-containing protein [Allorhodopirellula heiligendammensis]|uniref:Bacterial membrane flanked domain protein n=1 Tax=Allorhodopirellula heiligendammensis TaxID=2714739 RepID=A0A5C6BYZ0_9BACT|nr:PH domain-containing protein [Allorhodopirellula heiligendammensis]TWU16907.1 Bacterial membrane flanked domain protein [Allorhodopirellula heiligendammensis]